MRYFFTLLIINLFISCNFNEPKTTAAKLLVTNDTIPDPEKLSKLKLARAGDYRQVLEKLDQGELKSLDISGRLLKNCVADTATYDSMLVIFNDFINNLTADYLENCEFVNDQLTHSPSPETIAGIKNRLVSYGILLRSSEGAFYLEPENKFLLQNFGSGLSQAYRDFLTISSTEQQNRFAEDGTLLIPVDSLASRILAWENFMTRYPDFISIKLAQEKYTTYLGVFLSGMENSKIFSPETNRLNDSSISSFETFVRDNPGTKSTEVISAYLDLLKSTNFNYTEKVDSFLLEKVYH